MLILRRSATRQLAKAFVLPVGQADRQGGHSRSTSRGSSGDRTRNPGNWELRSWEVADILGDDDRDASRNGELDQVTVGLISQVRSRWGVASTGLPRRSDPQ